MTLTYVKKVIFNALSIHQSIHGIRHCKSTSQHHRCRINPQSGKKIIPELYTGDSSNDSNIIFNIYALKYAFFS